MISSSISSYSPVTLSFNNSLISKTLIGEKLSGSSNSIQKFVVNLKLYHTRVFYIDVSASLTAKKGFINLLLEI